MAGDKPLIAWIIESAKGAVMIDRLILSSDDADIISVAQAWGCEVPFVRPAELARDESRTIDVVLHAIEMIKGYDYVVLLQPTSPLIQSRHIDGCIRQCLSCGSVSLVSVCESSKSPYWMFTKDQDDTLIPFMGPEYLNKRRQEVPAAYIPNGAVYVADCGWLKQNGSFYAPCTKGYVVPQKYSIDIDTEMDFKMLEMMLETFYIDGDPGDER
jgi:N-acylneuraminate cytidylyltransferase